MFEIYIKFMFLSIPFAVFLFLFLFLIYAFFNENMKQRKFNIILLIILVITSVIFTHMKKDLKLVETLEQLPLRDKNMYNQSINP